MTCPFLPTQKILGFYITCFAILWLWWLLSKKDFAIYPSSWSTPATRHLWVWCVSLLGSQSFKVCVRLVFWNALFKLFRFLKIHPFLLSVGIPIKHRTFQYSGYSSLSLITLLFSNFIDGIYWYLNSSCLFLAICSSSWARKKKYFGDFSNRSFMSESIWNHFFPVC